MKTSIGSLTCPTADELFLGSCQSDSPKVWADGDWWENERGSIQGVVNVFREPL